MATWHWCCMTNVVHTVHTYLVECIRIKFPSSERTAQIHLLFGMLWFCNENSSKQRERECKNHQNTNQKKKCIHKQWKTMTTLVMTTRALANANERTNENDRAKAWKTLFVSKWAERNFVSISFVCEGFYILWTNIHCVHPFLIASPYLVCSFFSSVIRFV